MNDTELVEQIARTILQKHYNSNVHRSGKKLVPDKKPPWLAVKDKTPIPQSSKEENRSWTTSDIIPILLHSFLATLCYSIIVMRAFAALRKRRERNQSNNRNAR